MRSTGVGLALAILAIPFGAADADVQPATSHHVYHVVREGNQIGTNTVDVERRGDTTQVKIKAKISVKIMYVEVYRYDHEATESWKGGQLVSFRSTTDDNGTKHSITAAPAAGKLDLTVDGKQSTGPLTLRPASLWDKSFDGQSELFDPANGKRMAVKVKNVGSEQITVHGVAHKVEHYRISGEFERDLWFEGDTLIRMRLLGTDKSVVDSDLT